MTFEIIKDPSARVAAMQSGQVDLTINVPVREVERLRRGAALAAETQSDHARDPAASAQRSGLCRRQCAAGGAPRNRQGRAVEGVLRRRRGSALGCGRRPATPAYLTDFKFEYNPDARQAELLAKSGFSPDKAGADQVRRHQRPFPERLRHRARDRSRCGKKSASTPRSRPSNTRNISSSIAAPSCRRRRSIAGTTRPAIRKSLPAICSIRKCRSRPGRVMDVGNKVLELFNVADYKKRIEGYRDLNKFAVEKRRHHPAAAERADGGAQEDADLREIRQRLDSCRHDGLGVIGQPCAAMPRRTSGDDEQQCDGVDGQRELAHERDPPPDLAAASSSPSSSCSSSPRCCSASCGFCRSIQRRCRCRRTRRLPRSRRSDRRWASTCRCPQQYADLARAGAARRLRHLDPFPPRRRVAHLLRPCRRRSSSHCSRC